MTPPQIPNDGKVPHTNTHLQCRSTFNARKVSSMHFSTIRADVETTKTIALENGESIQGAIGRLADNSANHAVINIPAGATINVSADLDFGSLAGKYQSVTVNGLGFNVAVSDVVASVNETAQAKGVPGVRTINGTAAGYTASAFANLICKNTTKGTYMAIKDNGVTEVEVLCNNLNSTNGVGLVGKLDVGPISNTLASVSDGSRFIDVGDAFTVGLPTSELAVDAFHRIRGASLLRVAFENIRITGTQYSGLVSMDGPAQVGLMGCLVYLTDYEMADLNFFNGSFACEGCVFTSDPLGLGDGEWTGLFSCTTDTCVSSFLHCVFQRTLLQCGAGSYAFDTCHFVGSAGVDQWYETTANGSVQLYQVTSAVDVEEPSFYFVRMTGSIMYCSIDSVYAYFVDFISITQSQVRLRLVLVSIGKAYIQHVDLFPTANQGLLINQSSVDLAGVMCDGGHGITVDYGSTLTFAGVTIQNTVASSGPYQGCLNISKGSSATGFSLLGTGNLKTYGVFLENGSRGMFFTNRPTISSATSNIKVGTNGGISFATLAAGAPTSTNDLANTPNQSCFAFTP